MVQFLLSCLALAIAWFVYRRWAHARELRSRELAVEQFADQRPRLAESFLAAARASGMPRGLLWKDSVLSEDYAFAVDRVNGEFVGLVLATISFEAIAGGDMEEVEAVGNLRTATAIFTFENGHWTTAGKAAFNLEPTEVLEKFSETLAPFPSPE